MSIQTAEYVPKYKKTNRAKEIQFTKAKNEYGYGRGKKRKSYEPRPFLKKGRYPYILKTAKRKVYPNGFIGLCLRFIGAGEEIMSTGYFCEDKNGNLIDYISEEEAKIRFLNNDGYLYTKPYILLDYEYSDEYKREKFYFDTLEEFDHFNGLLHGF